MDSQKPGISLQIFTSINVNLIATTSRFLRWMSLLLSLYNEEEGAYRSFIASHDRGRCVIENKRYIIKVCGSSLF